MSNSVTKWLDNQYAPIQIVKQLYSATRILELNYNDCWNFVLDHILKDLALKGFPDEKYPSKEVTDDVIKMILSKYRNLSPAEIALALQMDRYGEFEKKESHYMFYGTEYVDGILKQYCIWKTRIANEFQLTRKTNQIEEKPDLEKINKEYLDTIIDEIKKGKTLRHINAYMLYDTIPADKIPSEDDRKKLLEEESLVYKSELNTKTEGNLNPLQVKQIVEKSSFNAKQIIVNRCKNIITCQWLIKKHNLSKTESIS